MWFNMQKARQQDILGVTEREINSLASCRLVMPKAILWVPKGLYSNVHFPCNTADNLYIVCQYVRLRSCLPHHVVVSKKLEMIVLLEYFNKTLDDEK